MSAEEAPTQDQRKMIEVNVSPTAADHIRHRFNPSDRGDVAQIKDLTGTLITMLEAIGERNSKLAIAESIIAIRHVQTASMWSVLAATKGL